MAATISRGLRKPCERVRRRTDQRWLVAKRRARALEGLAARRRVHGAVGRVRRLPGAIQLYIATHHTDETALYTVDSFTATVRVYTLHTIPLGLAAYQALRQASRERKAARASAAGAGATSVHPDARAVT